MKEGETMKKAAVILLGLLLIVGTVIGTEAETVENGRYDRGRKGEI